jgi:hypothetical protein
MSYLVNPYRFAVAGEYDADAQAYITAVETADGQSLETGVRDAINAFVVGCKSDGIWTAIKASCILAGARTLAGCLVPLVGAAPTNFNFVIGDYNRKTGLKGNASTKYISSNRAANVDPATNVHASVYITETDSRDTTHSLLGTSTASGHYRLDATSTTRLLILRTETYTLSGLTGRPIGFFGASRGADLLLNSRTNGVGYSTAINTGTTRSAVIHVFKLNTGGIFTDARMSFYSIGEALNLTSLENRLITLMAAYAAAIP